jgi:hypothetical protein
MFTKGLFDMTESELDLAVQAHYDRMLDEYLDDGPQPECSNCKYYDGAYCCHDKYEIPEEMDDDDYCDDYRVVEED